MFQKAVFRMTVWYAGAIIFLSLGFSYALYKASTHELTQLQTKQEELIRGSRGLLPVGYTEFNERRIEQINESKHNIAISLLYFNFLILALGILGAYLLAKQTLQPIEDAVVAQDRFTSDASHELRTPLTAIKTEIEVALRDKKLTLSEAKTLSESTLQEVAKLEALTNGLLKLAKHDTDKSDRQSVSLAAALDTALERVAPLAKVSNVSIKKNVSGNAWGEEWALTELFTILLDNAVKYSPKGKVTITSEELRGHTAITIADNGHGIKASDLPHIFNRFYRADTSRSKNKVEGYGLGLSIAGKIVENHNGTITVKSSVGKGTTFIIRLPLAS